CCMASLKQVTYVRERYPDAEIYFFYIDVRAPGDRYEKFYKMVKDDEKLFMIKGKVAEVAEEAGSGNITVVAENAVTGEKTSQVVEMAVLATGMQPTAANAKLPADLNMNADGFIINDYEKGGMFGAGCATKPADVVSSNQNATGMALKAIQTLVNR
ncbi:MAG: CoB--CoM heterodisulfide reductase iron-sulfur subunit A family protein, partial [Desulfobacterales bacterium]|nr:CoB--CoM heterodisulfide reductase iron-sulfur subunit A family protein [Desulfobacterales bacterium]